MLLVNGVEAHVSTPQGRFALSAQQYAPDVIHPDGRAHLRAFELAPWPCWRFERSDGTRIEQEVFACHGSARVLTTPTSTRPVLR